MGSMGHSADPWNSELEMINLFKCSQNRLRLGSVQQRKHKSTLLEPLSFPLRSSEAGQS